MIPVDRHFILATAGHVDHGKSSLVKALTGTDPDRLPEEKARGITIELGFARLILTDPERTDPGFAASLGLVDVPGHEDFVKNMVAGVGAIDLALLVVAADDGWMPQTEEHLQILEYLAVKRGVVALTKSDLVNDLAPVSAEVRDRLRGSALADAPLVPTSVVGGRGLAELRTALWSVVRGLPAARDHGRPRLAVDRAFTLKGFGTVVTGTLAGGGLRVGQEVAVQPAGLVTRVRSIQSHHEQLTAAHPGMRTALNLPDVPLAAPGQPGISRGHVVALPGIGVVATRWYTQLACSPRLTRLAAPAGRPLRGGTRVQVHHGSACQPARVRWLEAIAWAPGAVGFAELNFDAPVFALAGDRFVVRDGSGRATLAGGLMLVPASAPSSRRNGLLAASLRRLADATADGERWLAAMLAKEEIARRSDLERVSPFGLLELRQAVDRLIKDGRAFAVAESLVVGESWRAWLAAAGSTIQRWHHDHPEKPGLPVADLRAQFPQLAEPGFQALVLALAGVGFVRHGASIRAAEHILNLPPELAAAGRRVRRLLDEKPLEPPSRPELAPDAATRKAVCFLIDAGEAVDLGPELVLSAAAYARAVALISGHLRRTGGATVSDLRPVVGTSRRILIPLLEHLDKARVTLRRGDVRTLGPGAA